MKRYVFVCVVLLLPFAIRAQVIITIAGGNGPGFSGDGGPAKDAKLNSPYNVAVDDSGNVYIADVDNYRIRKINRAGVIKTIGGNGTSGYWGDGLNATDAAISTVTDFTFKNGVIYFAVSSSNCIRKIDTNGKIFTVAGTGTAGYSGDGGPATAATLNQPMGLTFDKKGNLYIVDLFNNRIRKIDTGGIINTIAGTGIVGFTEDGGRADTARLNLCCSIRKDKYDNLFFGDNGRIRKIDAVTGLLGTVAGNGILGYSGDGGPASGASIDGGYIAFDTSGNLLIAEGGNHRIRFVDHDNVIHTIAGNGGGGYSGDGGSPLLAALASPIGIAVDAKGNIFVADGAVAHAIREITLDTPTAVQEIAIAGANAFQFSPNPSAGKFTALFSSRYFSEATIVIKDVTGKKVWECTIAANREKEFTCGIPPGMYLLCVSAGQYHSTQKLIIC